MGFQENKNKNNKMCEEIECNQFTNGVVINSRKTHKFSYKSEGEINGSCPKEESFKKINVVEKTTSAQPFTDEADHISSSTSAVLSNKAVSITGWQKASVFIGAWLEDWSRVECSCGKQRN